MKVGVEVALELGVGTGVGLWVEAEVRKGAVACGWREDWTLMRGVARRWGKLRIGV